MFDKKKQLDKAIDKLNRLSGLKLECKDIPEENIDNILSKVINILDAYQEKYSLSNILYQILLGKLTYKEFCGYKQSFYSPDNIKYCLFLIQTKVEMDDILFKILRGLFPDKKNDYIIQIDKYNLAVVHSIASSITDINIGSIADSIVDSISIDAMIPAYISYSHIFEDLFSLSEIYNDAKLAIKINRIFYPNKLIIYSDKLNIGRLIYSLPKDVCKAFLVECFGKETYVDIDDDTKHTIDTFFRNNLNIAETARQLHMHRNTLVYRLEQVEKLTSIPIRSFDGAMKFNIALMIINFLENDF